MITRRRFLGAASLGALSACSPSKPGTGILGLAERWNETLERALFAPDRLVDESTSALTPDASWPSYHISPDVPLAPAGWALQVGGLVKSPLILSSDDLMRLPRTEVRLRHHCVEGWSAVASWHGVRLSELARVAGADPEAGYVEFRSFDQGYFSSWDRESALHPQTILAYGRNGDVLTPAYGAPLRVYSGVKLGYKMVKYVTAVNFLPHRTGGYWEDLGYEWFAGV